MKKSDIAPAYSSSWKKLYSMAKKFVHAQPWKLFENEDAFVVQSPCDNQMYLCCVLGYGGEEFGINAFRGAQGMRNFDKIITHSEDRPHDKNLMYELDMLSFTLSPREHMEKNDLKVTKKLMAAFPGGEWPLFRSFKPHFIPWFLTEKEIESLYDCLEQTLALCDESEESLDLIRNATPGRVLVRSKVEGEWVSRMLHVGYSAKAETPKFHLDDVTMQRLRKLPGTGPKEEIDLVHLPGTISDHEPPYFGLLLIGVNETLYAEQYGFFTPFTDYFKEACDRLVQSFLSRGSKPRMVFLKDDSSFADVFEPIAKQADIRFNRIDELPKIGDLLDDMEQSMKDDRFPLS